MAKTPKSPTEKVTDTPDGTVEDAVIVEDLPAEKPAAEEGAEPSDPATQDADSGLTEAAGDDAPESDTPEEGDGKDAADEAEGDAPDDPAPGDQAPAQDTPDDTPEQAEDHTARVEPDQPAPVVTAPRRGGFAPMVLGGVIAAGLGFLGAQYPDQWPFPAPEVQVDPLAQALDAQGVRLDAAEKSLADQGQKIGAMASQQSLADLAARVVADLQVASTRLATLETHLTALEARLTAVEKLPTGNGTEAAEAAAAAYQRELIALRTMFEAELAKVRTGQQDARTLSAKAATRAALANIMAALDSGAPFAEAAAELSSVTGAPLPAPLPDMAEDGVPTLAALQESFPEAARAALDLAIRAGVEEGSIGRAQAFLRTQLGVRSLEPKQGDDPDAVLSRAEAALHQGRIATALSELTALPEAAQPALADWISTAKARAAALEAGRALATQLNK